MSPCSASASHLPEALIHKIPSRLSEVFPLLAWAREGSHPMRADNDSSDLISDSFADNNGNSPTDSISWLYLA